MEKENLWRQIDSLMSMERGVLFISNVSVVMGMGGLREVEKEAADE